MIEASLASGIAQGSLCFIIITSSPTGSTCCAMVDFIHHSTLTLENNSYIHIIVKYRWFHVYIFYYITDLSRNVAPIYHSVFAVNQ